MDVTYMRKIQQWVECDNKLLQFKEDMKDFTDKKKTLEDDILEYVESQKYDKLTVNITDGHIKFGKRNTTQSLTMKLLKSLLEKYNDNSGTNKVHVPIEDVMRFISDNLEVKQKFFMNRELKKNDE